MSRKKTTVVCDLGCCTVAPYFDLRRALWIPAVLTWDATGASRRTEGPQGFRSYRPAAEASRFLARAVTRETRGISRALHYLDTLAPLMEARPPKVAAIKALLSEARQAGYDPASLYLSALKLHPKGVPLPPHPLDVIEAPRSGQMSLFTFRPRGA